MQRNYSFCFVDESEDRSVLFNIQKTKFKFLSPNRFYKHSKLRNSLFCMRNKFLFRDVISSRHRSITWVNNTKHAAASLQQQWTFTNSLMLRNVCVSRVDQTGRALETANILLVVPFIILLIEKKSHRDIFSRYASFGAIGLTGFLEISNALRRTVRGIVLWSTAKKFKESYSKTQSQ